ncbi:type II CAAX endopeptidase family protein [Porphyromonadaceae bacterium W3.11]|nr:type II CAAX endopeptidase family protein [Porphyromonadaceae bacterium W3.11]
MPQYKSYNQAAKPSIGYLFAILGFAMILGIISSVLITPLLNLAIADEAYLIFVTQIINAILTMLIPAWLTEKYFRSKHFTYLYEAKITDLNRQSIFYAIVLILAVIPLVSTSSYLMEQLPIPKFLEEAINRIDAMLDETYDLFLLEKRPLGIILSLISIAVIAPIAEEYLFRGAIQGWILSHAKNVHIAVWITAFIFSMIHMQWSGFLARFFLGAILGYTAIYGGIWMAIFLHFLNNLFTFILTQMYGAEDIYLSPVTTEDYIIIVSSTLCSIVIIYYIFSRMKKKNERELKLDTNRNEYEN